MAVTSSIPVWGRWYPVPYTHPSADSVKFSKDHKYALLYREGRHVATVRLGFLWKWWGAPVIVSNNG